MIVKMFCHKQYIYKVQIFLKLLWVLFQILISSKYFLHHWKDLEKYWVKYHAPNVFSQMNYYILELANRIVTLTEGPE